MLPALIRPRGWVRDAGIEREGETVKTVCRGGRVFWGCSGCEREATVEASGLDVAQTGVAFSFSVSMRSLEASNVPGDEVSTGVEMGGTTADLTG